MNAAKLQLSKDEMNLVQDPSWILTKNQVMTKVIALMAALSEDYKEVIKPLERDFQPPKISRGENYQGLPYVMLDYPRIFGREDVFAIRTMFWWGHYFSITLHLKGRYKDMFLPAIHEHLDLLALHQFHVSVGQDEWRHELSEENYKPIDIKTYDYMTNILSGNSFGKLSATCGLDQWDAAPDILLEKFRLLMRVVSSRAGGTGPLPGNSIIGSGL